MFMFIYMFIKFFYITFNMPNHNCYLFSCRIKTNVQNFAWTLCYFIFQREITRNIKKSCIFFHRSIIKYEDSTLNGSVLMSAITVWMKAHAKATPIALVFLPVSWKVHSMNYVIILVLLLLEITFKLCFVFCFPSEFRM